MTATVTPIRPTTPDDTAAQALAAASPDTLVDAIIRLTHMLHGATRTEQSDLRAQRDLARTELIARCTR